MQLPHPHHEILTRKWAIKVFVVPVLVSLLAGALITWKRDLGAGLCFAVPFMLIGIGTEQLMHGRYFRDAHERLNCDPVPDAQFLAQCEIPPAGEPLALEIRRALAKSGSLPEDLIFATDPFTQCLGWDDDARDIQLAVESTLKRRIRNVDARKVIERAGGDPKNHPILIKHYIQVFVECALAPAESTSAPIPQ